MLTKCQLLHLLRFCEDYAHPIAKYNGSILIREDMSSRQMFTACGFKKAIPITNYSYFLNFAVHHSSNSKFGFDYCDYCFLFVYVVVVIT